LNIVTRLSQDVLASPQQIEAAVKLLDDGATVPFIARYRKEVTGGLDDGQLRKLAERLAYLREMEERRAAIGLSILEQGKMTDALRAEIDAADSKARLEDLYLPFRQKRRTKAQIAREAGLEPLADMLLGNPGLEPEQAALSFVDIEKSVNDVRAALDGARQILIERMAEDADLLGDLRNYLWQSGILTAKLANGMAEAGAKFSDYFDYSEKISSIPSHRALALFRGRNENILLLKLEAPDEAAERDRPGHSELAIARRFAVENRGRPGDRWLLESVRWAWRVKIHLHLELELLSRLREAAEAEAIDVFGRNLRSLLLAPPAGARAVLGLDPGVRTGVKMAVVDRTGKVVSHGVIYPHQPRNDWDGSIAEIAALVRKFAVELVAVGNGTASRETDKLVADTVVRHPDLGFSRVMVSEAGASVYSASEVAAAEFPELDVTIRGAISIARRLQDPLAELVKIDPKAIGVGQYQHDVDQQRLGRTLDSVVEDCVNGVGVDLNTASALLLARVAGLGPVLARNIVSHRDRNGPFADRQSLLGVERLGPKAFEQAAGFLRITKGRHPLDASSVHPEAYPLVQRIAARNSRSLDSLIGDGVFLRSLQPADYTDERFGLPTVTDVLAELEKPGRDPRGGFKTAEFKEGVEKPSDLKPGMILEGVVTNVTNFGAFVDVGVHQDGLVHISALANRFVKDPHEVVKAGDVVKVKVLEIDLKRNRIALSMRLDERPDPKTSTKEAKPEATKPASPPATGALAEAFARARRR
jgi:uncharacterized protein